MKIPADNARYEIEIKRSRFIAEIEGCADRATAEEKIQQRRDEHPEAAHVVYAFSIGDTSSRQFGMSDDGEPKGTAGRPVLEVMKGSDVTDCVITVVRYFGGTKLGTGGLVHAYGDAAKGAFGVLKTTKKRDLVTFTIEIPYELHNTVRTLLEQHGGEIGDEGFTEEVIIRGTIDRSVVTSLQEGLKNVSRGTITATIDE